MRDSSTPGGQVAPLIGMSGVNWLLFGLLGLIWGSGFMFSTIAVRDIPPATTVLMRVILASAILYALLRRQGIALPSGWHAWMPFFVLGLFNTAIPFTLNAWSLTRIESGLAGILTASVPIFTVIVAHLATRDERATGMKVAGIILGMAGVITIFGLDSATLTSGSGLGKLAILLSCLLYAASAVYARTVRGAPPLLLAFGQLSAAAILMIPWVLIIEQPLQTAEWTREAVMAVIVLGIFASALAYLIFYRLLTTSGATSTSLVSYVIPAVAVLLGALFLDERLLWRQLFGMVLILAGMAIIDGRLTQWLMRGRTVRTASTER